MKQVNKTSLEFKDGGSMVQLGAYHELHCVVGFELNTHGEHFNRLTGTIEMDS